ncbi:hypothetical protein PsYK624_015130 [Phanerochaete sordida]|uniref:Uncharacterized protein n=1 Tax=Phanerochaete sordida TaxID=48140 RepID=A0A9P3L8E6_9APHY|nr:hypothetical protein PsYK624_015130 [Phanerochaete sordida]
MATWAGRVWLRYPAIRRSPPLPSMRAITPSQRPAHSAQPAQVATPPRRTRHRILHAFLIGARSKNRRNLDGAAPRPPARPRARSRPGAPSTPAHCPAGHASHRPWRRPHPLCPRGQRSISSSMATRVPRSAPAF